jgi:hypothetical protein
VRDGTEGRGEEGGRGQRVAYIEWSKSRMARTQHDSDCVIGVIVGSLVFLQDFK